MTKNSLEDAILLFNGSMDNLNNTPVPSVEAVDEWKNYNERKLFLDFEVCPLLGQFSKYILRWNLEDNGKKIKERTPIKIYINSPGGFLSDCLAFIDILKLSKTPIHLICMGSAHSAAGYIFMCKSDNITRYMLPHSKVLIHQGSVGIQEAQTTQFLDAANHIKKEEVVIRKHILENTSITEKLYNKKRKEEWMLTAEQCVKFGICDKIVDNIDDIM